MTVAEELLAAARDGDASALGKLLDHYRPYLGLMARRQLDSAVQVRVDASDVVQQTCLEAIRDLEAFRGQSEPELIAWIMRILRNNVAQSIQYHVVAKKRSIRKEQTSPDDSQGPLVARLPAHHSSPSQRLMRGELAVQLARQLASLTDEQQEAIRLRYVEGLPLTDIARRMQRSESAAAGLLKRGLRVLRSRLNKQTVERG